MELSPIKYLKNKSYRKSEDSNFFSKEVEDPKTFLKFQISQIRNMKKSFDEESYETQKTEQKGFRINHNLRSSSANHNVQKYLEKPNSNELSLSARKYLFKGRILKVKKDNFTNDFIDLNSQNSQKEEKFERRKTRQESKKNNTTTFINRNQAVRLTSENNNNNKLTEMSEITNKRIRINTNFLKQIDVVLDYIFKGNFFNKKRENIINEWIKGLDKYQDHQWEINLYKYIHFQPIFIPKEKISKDLKTFYCEKNNSQKVLTPGEEATVISTIKKIIDNINNEPNILFRSVQSVVEIILRKAKLEKLKYCKIVNLQVEFHWKIMFTTFCYSGNTSCFKNKEFKKVFESNNYKAHLINIYSNDDLAKFLLENSEYF